MADIPTELEWDGRTWIPVTGAPNRPIAKWNPYVGNWDVTKPASDSSGLLGMLPQSVERGVRTAQERTNELLNTLGLQSTEDTAARIAELERRKKEIAPPEEIQQALSDITNAESIGDAVKLAIKNPNALLSVIGESLGAFAPDMIGGVGVGGLAAKGLKIAIPTIARRLALGVGLGSSSGTIEYTSTILEELNKAGVPLTDETQLLQALIDPNIMGPVREKALKRGVPIGAVDGLSAGVAGRIYQMLGGLGEGASVGRRLGAAGAELGAQGSFGAAGETIGQYSAEGEITSPGSILLEGIAEIAGAPFEAYAALRGQTPAATEAGPTPEQVEQARRLVTGLGYDTAQFTDDAALVAGAQRILAELEMQKQESQARMSEQSTTAADRIKRENVALRLAEAQERTNQQLGRQEGQLTLEQQAAQAADRIERENAALRISEAQERTNEKLNAQELLKGRAATEPRALPAPDASTRPTDLGQLTDSQIDEHLRTNAHVPRIKDILEADIPVERKRALGLQALADMGPANATVTDPETRIAETVNVGLPYAQESMASEEQARAETDRIRQEVTKTAIGKPVPELTPGLESQFNDEGLIRPAPDGNGYVRASEPRSLPPGITRDQYRAVEDHVLDAEPGTKVGATKVKELTGLKKPADQRKVLDLFTSLGLLKDAGKGKPPVVASMQAAPQQVVLPPTGPVNVQDIGRRIAGPEVQAMEVPQEAIDTLMPGASGLSSDNQFVVSESRPTEEKRSVAVHEATHTLTSMGKLTADEIGALLSEKGQAKLQQIIDWGMQNGHRLGALNDVMPLILGDETKLSGATAGQVERIAYAAETEQFRRDAGLKYNFEPGGLIRRALDKILKYLRAMLGGGPDAIDLVKDIVSGKFAGRAVDTGPRVGAVNQADAMFDAEASVETAALPETSAEYASRAALGVREMQVAKWVKPTASMAAAPVPKGKVAAPPASDLPVFMNWFNWHINSLGYNAAKHKALGPYAMAVQHYDRLSANLRRQFQDQVQDVFELRQADTDALTNFLVVKDALAENARPVTNPDGSVTIRWKPEEEKSPLPKFMQTGEVTLPAKLVPLEQKTRAAFDKFHREMIDAMLSRFGVAKGTTADQLREQAKTASAAKKEELLNLAYLVEQSYGYHKNYLPHDRPFTPSTVRFTVGREGEQPRVYHIDSPFGRSSSIRRAQALQRELAKQFPASEGWSFGQISPMTSQEFLNYLSGEDAADLVQTLGSIVLKGDNRKFVDENGNQVTATELFMRAISRVREEAGKQGFARRTRQRKMVGGYIHEGNYKTYLKATMSDYFMRGSEWLAGSYTAKERADAISGLRGQPDLMNYALERENYIQSSNGMADKLRAIAFHWALGFNFSSAILNTFQALHTTFPYLSQVSSVTKASPAIIRAYRDAIRLAGISADPDKIFRLETKPSWMPQDEFELLKMARNEGITEPLMTTEYAGGIAGKFSSPRPISGRDEAALGQIERLAGVGVRKVASLSSSMFSFVEQANRIAAVLASYRLAKGSPKIQENMKRWFETAGFLPNKDLSVQELALLAAQETQYNMTKANRPVFLQGVGGVIFQFAQYPIYTMELMVRAANATAGKGFWKTTEGKKMLGLMLLGVWATAGTMGLPVVSQLGNAWDLMAKSLSPLVGMDIPEFEQTVREFLVDFNEEVLGVDDPIGWTDTIMKGGFRQASGLSVEQRTALDWPRTDMLTGNILDALGPFSSLIGGGAVDAVGYLSQGHTTLALASMMPLAVRNVAKARVSQTVGLPSPTTGNTPVLPGELSLGDQMKIAIGFTPSELADIREAASKVKGRGEAAKDAFASRMANALGKMLSAQDRGDQKTAEAMYAEFNALIDKVVEHDLAQTDPAKMIAPDFESFYKNRVEPRMMRNYVEGPFGETAMKRVPKDQRDTIAEKLETYYGRGPK